MARPRYPKHTGPPPPALPPVARTVGQVIAEGLRLYGSNFLPGLVLGLPLAVSTVAAHALGNIGFADRSLAAPIRFDRDLAEQTLILVALAPFLALAYARACVIESGTSPARGRWLLAVVLGTLVFLPAAATLAWFNLAAIAWLGLVGWAVPVSMHEGLGAGATLRRAFALGRADPVHAIGGIAALVLVFYLSRLVLAFLLRSQADNTAVVAAFLADLVISPVLLLGPAVQYRDQVARVGTTRADRLRARAEAMAARAE